MEKLKEFEDRSGLVKGGRVDENFHVLRNVQGAYSGSTSSDEGPVQIEHWRCD